MRTCIGECDGVFNFMFVGEEAEGGGWLDASYG